MTDMEKEVRRILVGEREGRHGSHPAGSKGGYRCSRCAASMVITESGQQLLKEEPAMGTICYECFRELDPANATYELTPDAFQGAIEDVVRRIFRTARRRAEKARFN